MANYAVIDESTDEIVNIAIWDNVNDIVEEDGFRYVNIDAHPEWHIGGTLTVGESYTPPVIPEPEDE